jgi:hypothetical protein
LLAHDTEAWHLELHRIFDLLHLHFPVLQPIRKLQCTCPIYIIYIRVPTNSLFDLTIFINYLHYSIIMSMVEGFTFLFSTKLEFYCHTDDSFIKISHFQCWFLSRFKKKSLKSMLHFEPHCSFRPSSYKLLGIFFLYYYLCFCLLMCLEYCFVKYAIQFSCVLHYFQDIFPPSYPLLGFSVISVKNARCQAMNKVTAW